jgi:Na+-driven multidrug efflux pump
MRSRFAWLVAVMFVLIVAVTLFLTYQLGYMGFPLTWFLGIVDLILFALFLGYTWKRREPYFRYVAAKEI